MALFKCKSCGGELNITEGATVVTCEYCENTQTVPTVRDEAILSLFNRANNLRIKCEFDKAEDIYRKITNEKPNEAEGYWGLVLCKFGIEYVEDPKTFKRVPTCHRASFEAVTADVDYLAALEHADSVARANYEEAAKAIDKIQKEILAVVKNEKPFDVFICYKETDENGKRTQDSVIANDIYHQLTQEGFKVFYAAITLEDKLGEKYEPYIFAALNSAKVMLVLGTRPEYFTSVWVKNEWSRFLKLMKTDSKKLLIPCFRDMDAYDLPEEFSHLQAQDMSKIGFISDVVRGIKKVIGVENTPAETSAVQTSVPAANAGPLLERAFMFLEDENWQSADEYCEKVLDIEPKNALAYLGKLLVELKLPEESKLATLGRNFSASQNYQKAIRFADDDLKNRLNSYLESAKKIEAKAKAEVAERERMRLEEEEKKKQEILHKKYTSAKLSMPTATTAYALKKLADDFKSISPYLDSAELAEECMRRAEIYIKKAEELMRMNKEKENEQAYNQAVSLMQQAKTADAYIGASNKFNKIRDYKDSSKLSAECKKRATSLKNLLTEYNNKYPLTNDKNKVVTDATNFMSLYEKERTTFKQNFKSIFFVLPLFIIFFYVLTLSKEEWDVAFITGGLLALFFGFCVLVAVVSTIGSHSRVSKMEETVALYEHQLREIETYPTFEEFCKQQGFNY